MVWFWLMVYCVHHRIDTCIVDEDVSPFHGEDYFLSKPMSASNFVTRHLKDSAFSKECPVLTSIYNAVKQTSNSTLFTHFIKEDSGVGDGGGDAITDRPALWHWPGGGQSLIIFAPAFMWLGLLSHEMWQNEPKELITRFTPECSVISNSITLQISWITSQQRAALGWNDLIYKWRVTGSSQEAMGKVKNI